MSTRENVEGRVEYSSRCIVDRIQISLGWDSGFDIFNDRASSATGPGQMPGRHERSCTVYVRAEAPAGVPGAIV